MLRSSVTDIFLSLPVAGSLTLSQNLYLVPFLPGMGSTHILILLCFGRAVCYNIRRTTTLRAVRRATAGRFFYVLRFFCNGVLTGFVQGLYTDKLLFYAEYPLFFVPISLFMVIYRGLYTDKPIFVRLIIPKYIYLLLLLFYICFIIKYTYLG